jgi:hypothetical protein
VKLFFIYLTFFFSLLFFYGKDLVNYVPNGDDLVLLGVAPTNITSVANRFVQFDNQYRPLSHLLFNIFRIFSWNTSQIFILNLSIVSLVPFLIFLLFQKSKHRLPIFFATLSLFLSPFFYYHFFTLAGFINILLLISQLSLLLILFSKSKNIKLAVVIFISSIFLKENFLLNTLLLILIFYKKYNLSQKFKIYTSLALLFTFGYFLFRLSVYKVVDPNYSFIFTFAKAKENILLIISWLFNYPRGWQYGAPLSKNIFIYLIPFSTIILYTVFVLKANKKFLILISVFLFLSIAPFIFLNRILVFYFDASIIILSLALLKTNYKFSLPLIFISLLQYFLIYPQWQQYSFIALSNRTARNYLKTISSVDTSPYENICLVGDQSSNWSIDNGKLANVYFQTDFPVVKQCTQKSLIIESQGESFFIKN